MANLDSLTTEEILARAVQIEKMLGPGGHLRRSYDEAGRALTEEQRQMQEIEEALAELDEKRKEKQAKLLNSVTSTIKGVTSFGASIAGNTGGFDIANKAIDTMAGAATGLLSKLGPLGAAGSAVVQAGAEVAKMSVNSFQKAYNTFESLSEVGVLQSFTDVNTAARSLGLSYDKLNEVLSKSSKDLAAFGGTVGKGLKDFQELAVASGSTRDEFQRLGISAADFNESQLKYSLRMRRGNQDRKVSVDELQAGTREYMIQLDALSKITGLNRKDIENDRAQREMDVKYRATIALADPKVRDNVDNFLDMLRGVEGSEDVVKAVMHGVANAGVASGKEGAALATMLNHMGISYEQFTRGLKDGSIKAPDAMNMLIKGSEKSSAAIKNSATLKGDENNNTRMYIFQANLTAKKGIDYNKLTKEQIEAAKKQLKEEGTQNQQLADTTTKMRKASANMEQLLGGSTIVTKSVDLLATGLDYAAEGMYKMLGKDLPSDIKARIEERKATEKETKALKELEEEKKAEEKPNTLGGVLYGAIFGTKGERVERAEAKLAEAQRERKAKQESRISAEKAAGTYREPPKPPAPAASGAAAPAPSAGATTTPVQATPATSATPVAATSAQAAPSAPATAATATSTAATPTGEAVTQSTTSATQAGTTAPVDGIKAVADKKTAGSIEALLDLIGKLESGGNYNILVGGGTANLTEMTVGKVMDLQSTMISKGKESTAVGKYQIILPTLNELIKRQKVTKEDKFDKATQDRLAIALLESRGLKKYLQKQITAEEFADNISKVWASLPYNTGKSYYDKVGSNKSLTPRSTVLSALPTPQAAKGAIVRPKNGGVLVQVAEAGQAEAIVPMPDGKTIPVKITNMADHSSGVHDIFAGMISRLDRMIAIIGTDNKHKKQIAVSTA